jgi:AbrB family looped-hinge helix DNA binding protein
MVELIQVRKKAQVTLPLSVRRKLNIEEGDLLDVNVRDGEIVLRPKKLIDKDQAWFWTRRWQEGERQADEDIKAGRVYHFPDADSAIAYLHDRVKKQTSRKK